MRIFHLLQCGVCISYIYLALALVPSYWISESSLTTFILRSIVGALSSSIYLLAVLTRCQGKMKMSLSACTCTLLFIIRQTALPIEVLACTWSVLYGLFVLSLSEIMHSKRIDVQATARENLRPLAFLTGAKLLTILCYNLPFACVAIRYFHLLATSNHIDASILFNHLMVFICTRCVLGIFTIFDDVPRFKYHLSMSIYLVVLMVALLLLLNERINMYLMQNGYEFGAGAAVSGTYAILSVYIDSIGHSANILATPTSSFGIRSQSIVFASCIEHLIDVGFMVAYLHQLIDSRHILMAMCFCGLSNAIQTMLHSIATTNDARNSMKPLKPILEII